MLIALYMKSTMNSSDFLKKRRPCVKTAQLCSSIRTDLFTHRCKCYFGIVIVFGEKLIRKTDDLFFNALRGHVPQGERKPALPDFGNGQSCSDMPFADECVAGKRQLLQHGSPKISVRDVRECTETPKQGSVRPDHADIMK